MVDNLLMFTGTECHFCREMDPLVERLEKEESVKVTKLEVWHNAKNAEFLTKVDKIGCGGVPFFFNQKTGKAICGASSYEDLRKWALGK